MFMMKPVQSALSGDAKKYLCSMDFPPGCYSRAQPVTLVITFISSIFKDREAQAEDGTWISSNDQ